VARGYKQDYNDVIRDGPQAEIEKLQGRVERIREYNYKFQEKVRELKDGVEELEKENEFLKRVYKEYGDELAEIRNNAVGIGPGDTVLYGTAQDCEIASEWLATHTYDDEMIDAAWHQAIESRGFPSRIDILEEFNIFECEGCGGEGITRQYPGGEPLEPCEVCSKFTGHGWVIRERWTQEEIDKARGEAKKIMGKVDDGTD
jgi:FtsZ-binding cell division protein ZapB